MVNIAILGYGTVGGGVREVLEKNAAEIEARLGGRINITRILDIRDFPNDPARDIITRDFNVILEDKGISAAAETMGGIEPANTYVAALLARGISVATSNKELVAAHGAELMALAGANGCRFMFEASVCGGVPIIDCLSESLCAERITSVVGILNGTTNFMLSRMGRDGISFSAALAEAQRLGYAEKNPEADIDGYDTRRKLAILASLALGLRVRDESIATEGISRITDTDFKYAERLGMSIKLLAICTREGGGAACVVAPHLVGKGDIFAATADVYNAVRLCGDSMDDVMLCGKGAGKLPTGCAVVSDILSALSFPAKKPLRVISSDVAQVGEAGAGYMPRFARVATADVIKAGAAVKTIFAAFEPFIVVISGVSDELGLLAYGISGAEFDAKLAKLKETGAVNDVITKLRIYRP